jgi:hypothetical protein
MSAGKIDRPVLLSPYNQLPIPASNQTLKILLAQGRLEQAFDTLVGLTEHSNAADLRQRVLTLSGQFSQLKKQHLTGLLDDKDYRLQWNRIAAAVAEIADSEAVTASHRLTTGKRWRKRAAVFAILASIAAVTGYTLRDFFFKKTAPAPFVLPVAEQSKKDTLIIVMPPPSKSVGKSNVHIEVKDKAKVGNIITGDSNKIDIKQDF